MNLAQQALAMNNLGRAQELLDRHRPGRGETDLRGWEWCYLWQQGRSEALFTLCQRTNSIFSLDVSSDGRWLAVGEFEKGGLSIWDLQTRREIAGPPAGESSVRVAFSPRARLLAYSQVTGFKSGTPRNFVRLWDVEAKALVAELSLNHYCRGLAFSGDGQRLVTCSAGPEGQMALWQIPEGRRISTCAAPQDDTGIGTAFAVAPDLSLAAYRGRGGKTLNLINPVTGELRWSYTTPGEGLVSFALSADGKTLASSSGASETFVRLWDAAAGRELGRLEGHRAYVIGLQFWPDGTTLCSAGADQTIQLWDLVTRQSSGRLRGHRTEVWRLALLPDGNTLVSGGKDGSVCLWDAAKTQSGRVPVRLSRKGLDRWWFDQDGRGIVTLATEGRLSRWPGTDLREPVSSIDLGRSLVDFNPQTQPTGLSRRRFFARSNDGHWFALGSTNGVMDVWDLPQGRLSQRLTVSTGAVSALAFLDHGRSLLFFTHEDRLVHQRDLSSGRAVRSYARPLPANFRVWAMTADGSRALALDVDGRGGLLNVVNDQADDLSLQVEQVDDAAFSPDGRQFAVASMKGVAKLWDTASGRELATLGGFMMGVHSVAFSPDGRRLAVASGGSQTVKLWDVASQQEVITLETGGYLFRSTAFSPDGNMLGSMAAADGALYLWRAPSWAEIEAVEKRDGRSRK